MVTQEEARAASFTGPLSSAGASSAGLKLPLLLTARPGNVGVQIDAHRAMNLLSHPRSIKFTSQFHEIMFENGSLENYSRVVERTAQRSRILQDKLEKLRAREQYLLEDEEKRKQRRIQREAARQRRVWQMHQAAKRADERAREAAAAVAVQKVIRGALARRLARVLRQARDTHEAASMLQRAIKTYVSRQQLARERERRSREEEERRELEIHSAAAVLQRQARKRLKVVQEAQQLAAYAEDEENEDESEDEDETEEATSTPVERPLSADDKNLAEALSRGISLDLLFSDEEDSEGALPTNSTSSSSIMSIESAANSQRILPQPPPPTQTAAHRSRRPLSIKRVGGGYRTKPLPHNTPSPPQETTPDLSPSTTRTSRERMRLQGTTAASSAAPSVSEEFLRHSRRSSPPIPKAATPLAAQPAQHASRPTTSTQKSDGDELRAASPAKASTVSPYAIPQRLPRSSST
ncbi:Hsp90 cochaperone shq1 [Phytophthora pseudosyringae]|uniref:Hsp90 cochaperone shq1 n=1 Tax=Phytophthora pseudosyringae TaxID=221518 RepID=A0A8T1VM85_9STRA|nr:Hsp90 cochaperone shq1 [Phytophthora pseudosyringae]